MANISEVVERLANEAATEIMKKRHNLGYGFITTVAEDTEIIKRVFMNSPAILHEWLNNYSCPCGERGCCYEYFKEHKNGK